MITMTGSEMAMSLVADGWTIEPSEEISDFPVVFKNGEFKCHLQTDLTPINILYMLCDYGRWLKASKGESK